jgi:bacillithiol biosynthesis cysteine-adding enzyme BshC
MKRDIISNQPFDLVRNTNQQLVESGYHVQVNPRQINLFYLADGIRNRIVATEKGFKVFQTDIRFSESELSEELQNHPERFSPNVVLRPLFQELVLPNLAYVGGAGELSYWLQYKAYFNEMGVSFPLLSLRNHFLLIDAGTVDRMDELNLLPEDLFKSIDELVKEHVLELSDADVSVSGEIEKIHMLYHRLKQRAQEIDASLSASIESEETRLVKAMEQWGGRFSRSLKKNHEVSVNRIRNVYKKLFPNDYLQERHDNFLEFQSKYNGNLLDGIYENTHPFDTQFTILRFRKS